MPIDENVFFRQVTMRMSSSLEFDVALRRTMAYLVTVMPVRVLILAIFESTFDAVRVIGSATAEKGANTDIWIPLPSEVRPLAEDIWSSVSGPEVMFLHELRDELSRPLLEVFAISALVEDRTASIAKALGVDSLLTDENASLMLRILKVADQRIAAMVLDADPGVEITEEHVRLIDLMNAPCAVAVSNALKHAELQRLRDRLDEENKFLRGELRQLRGETIIGADGGLRPVMELVRRVAPLDAPVLLLGETGVGKEVIASAIHRASPRREGPFVTVNCGAIPEALIDSELFGHERGAFTGAASGKKGRFERADGGTIFLDEIGELPLSSQVRLLRVLQTHELERVGGQAPMAVDFRMIAATNRDLRAMVEAETFREDLWYRLDVFPIEIPPLRERAQDIPALVRHFAEVKAAEQRLSTTPSLAKGAIEQLQSYSWPGNVRELANVVERAMILAPERPLSFDWLQPSSSASGQESPPVERRDDRSLDEVMAEHIRRVLRQTGGRVGGPGGAAEILGVHANTLRHRMRKLGVPFGRSVRMIYFKK